MSGNQYRCVVSGSLNSNAATLTVNPLPVVALNLPFDTLYQNSPVQILSGASPAGGTFSGTGISGGSFLPAAIPIGNYTTVYRYTDANGCINTATDVYTIINRVDKINFYPNPAAGGNVTVIVSPELVGGNATVYSESGQKMAQWVVSGRQTSYRFKWAAGNYTLVIRKGSAEEIKRFIIAR
jgi:hypothetical protein